MNRNYSAIFADSIQIVTIFIEDSLKTHEKLKELEIMYQDGKFICISWYRKTCWFPVKNTDVSRAQSVCHVIHVFYEFSFGKV